MPWTVVVCHGCNAINPSFPPYRRSPVLCWRLCCSKMAFPSQTHYAEFCLFLVRCLLLFTYLQLLKMAVVRCRALGDVAVLLPCVLGELLVFVAALARRKDDPMGGTSGNTSELLHTTAARSQTCPELWCRFCSVSVPDVEKLVIFSCSLLP